MIKYPHNLPTGIEYVGPEVIRKTTYGSSPRFLEYMKVLCTHFIQNPDPLVVPIYNFRELGPRGGGYVYSYDMMALGMLSPSEKQTIDTAINRWDRTNRLPSQDRSDSILGCWILHRPLMKFLDEVFRQNKYDDLHDGNIMIDLEENYRLIDIEGFLHYPIDNPKHNWIKEKISSEGVTLPSTNGRNTNSIRGA